MALVMDGVDYADLHDADMEELNEESATPSTDADRRRAEKREKLGKRLCYLLRYAAEKEQMRIDDDGFVKLDDVMWSNMIRLHHTVDEVMEEVETSVSMRNAKRFESKKAADGSIWVRASYGRQFERSPFHEGTSVLRLINVAVDFVSKNIQRYDLTDFTDDYCLNLIMRKMRSNGTLTNKALRQFLVPSLRYLDLNNVFVTEATLKQIAKKCPQLKQLSLKQCGYGITDQILPQTIKGLSALESLNLCGCTHLTDASVAAIRKHCRSLKHLNLTFATKISEAAILQLVKDLPQLEELNIYDYKNMSQDTLAKIYAVAEGKPTAFRMEITGLTSNEQTQQGGVYDSKWEKPRFR